MRKIFFRNLEKKYLIILLITTLLLISFNVIYILFFEKINVATPVDKGYIKRNFSKPYSTSNIPRLPRANDYGFHQDVDNYDNVDPETNLITYVKDKKIYSREITKNYILGKEILLAQLSKDVTDYVLTPDKKYIVYSYAIRETKKGDKFDMGGIAHNVDLLNISTRDIKTIYNYDPLKGQILTLTVSPYKNVIFIGTDFRRLFFYDINSNKLIDFTDKEDYNFSDLNNFCIGYKVFDQSPDLSHVLLQSYCYEGSGFYLYNLNTKERINIGFHYASGPRVKKFIENGSFLVENCDDGDIVNIGKYNYQNQLVQELPITKIDDITDKSVKKIYYKYVDDNKKIREYYLTSEKEITENKGDTSVLVKTNQFLGTGISLVKVFN